MQRCIELAARGLGNTQTNPLVGCVVVHDGIILGEGYHERFGGPHAEVNALSEVKNPELFSEATVYVSLEPCAHFGKTPPCCDLLINKGVKKVVIAMADPFPKVNGEGIRRLKAAGIEVEVGLLQAEAEALNRRFLVYQKQNRPYIILKWMQSADGFIGRSNESIQISNPFSSRMVHRWRSEEAGILIGPETAIQDQPSLNTRLMPGKNPTRILLDRDLRVPHTGPLFVDKEPLWIINTLKEGEDGKLCYIRVERANFLQKALQRVHDAGILSILVEGGAAIHQAFLQEQLWDEVRIGVGPDSLGSGIKAPAWPDTEAQRLNVLDDSWYFFNKTKPSKYISPA